MTLAEIGADLGTGRGRASLVPVAAVATIVAATCDVRLGAAGAQEKPEPVAEKDARTRGVGVSFGAVLVFAAEVDTGVGVAVVLVRFEADPPS